MTPSKARMGRQLRLENNDDWAWIVARRYSGRILGIPLAAALRVIMLPCYVWKGQAE